MAEKGSVVELAAIGKKSDIQSNESARFLSRREPGQRDGGHKSPLGVGFSGVYKWGGIPQPSFFFKKIQYPTNKK